MPSSIRRDALMRRSRAVTAWVAGGSLAGVAVFAGLAANDTTHHSTSTATVTTPTTSATTATTTTGKGSSSSSSTSTSTLTPATTTPTSVSSTTSTTVHATSGGS